MDKMRTFRCDSTTWRKFKLICTLENISMQAQLNSLVAEYVNSKTSDTSKLLKENE